MIVSWGLVMVGWWGYMSSVMGAGNGRAVGLYRAAVSRQWAGSEIIHYTLTTYLGMLLKLGI